MHTQGNPIEARRSGPGRPEREDCATNPIRLARKAAGLSMEALAEQLFVAPVTIQHWETGAKFPQVRVAKRLVRALPGLTLDAIYAGLN